jgi:hypothetical protein
MLNLGPHAPPTLASRGRLRPCGMGNPSRFDNAAYPAIRGTVSTYRDVMRVLPPDVLGWSAPDPPSLSSTPSEDDVSHD